MKLASYISEFFISHFWRACFVSTSIRYNIISYHTIPHRQRRITFLCIYCADDERLKRSHHIHVLTQHGFDCRRDMNTSISTAVAPSYQCVTVSCSLWYTDSAVTYTETFVLNADEWSTLYQTWCLVFQFQWRNPTELQFVIWVTISSETCSISQLVASSCLPHVAASNECCWVSSSLKMAVVRSTGDVDYRHVLSKNNSWPTIPNIATLIVDRLESWKASLTAIKDKEF